MTSISSELMLVFSSSIRKEPVRKPKDLLPQIAIMFQTPKTSIVSQIVPKTKFITLTVLEDYGVLIAICGRHRHIRMYGLEALAEKQTKKGKSKKDPFIKIRETRYCSHYSIGISRPLSNSPGNPNDS